MSENPIINVSNFYTAGQTVTLPYIFSDSNNNPQDPASVSAYIVDSNNNQTPLAPTKIAIGKYTVSYQIPTNPTVGVYTIVFVAISGTYTQTMSYIFSVV
jgi:hypothetical protein